MAKAVACAIVNPRLFSIYTRNERVEYVHLNIHSCPYLYISYIYSKHALAADYLSYRLQGVATLAYKIRSAGSSFHILQPISNYMCQSDDLPSLSQFLRIPIFRASTPFELQRRRSQCDRIWCFSA
jgi:hypothetical protein